MWQRIAAMIMIGLMCPLASAGIAGGMLPVSGGHVSAIVCGPPVYDYFLGCSRLNITILGPANGSTYYMPNISPNVTFYVSGANNPLCQYNEGGTWNNVSCANGNNTETITLPQGWPLSFTFRITDGTCTAEHTISLYVSYGRHTLAGGRLIMILIILLIPLGAILLLGDKHPPQRASRRTQRA
jgi:hypothetical protein